MILTQAKIKGPPGKDGPFNKLNLFPIAHLRSAWLSSAPQSPTKPDQVLFCYQHVICFDLFDPSCLQESEEERYYDEGYGDDGYT